MTDTWTIGEEGVAEEKQCSQSLGQCYELQHSTTGLECKSERASFQIIIPPINL